MHEVTSERRSMRTAIALNLLMGVAGILASWWTQAQALALDGLVSGLNAMAIVVAARLSGSLGRPQDRRYPFGYWALETIYLGGRSLMLLGIIVFAAISSIERILSYMINADGAVPPRFDLIAPYSVLMVALCLVMAATHHRNWLRGGRQSRLLAIEGRGALLDAGISAGVGVAFALTPLLSATPLEWVIPISDAIVVLVLCGLLVRSPLRSLMASVAELGGESAHPSIQRQVINLVSPELTALDITLVDLAVFPSGRALQGILYLDPHRAIVSSEVDQLRDSLERLCRCRFPIVTLEVVLSQREALLGKPA